MVGDRVGQAGWDFGDGTSGTGPSARHRYTVAGDYTVRVTVTDGAGNARTTTRVIAVDDPYDDTPDLSSPSDTDLPVDPPAVDPPFVDPLPVSRPPATEARLSGRTVRLNALVKTTPSRCRGSATVVYNLPGRRYTATVTLVRTASGCRASGTIRLAKAPAKRATLRLALAAPGSRPGPCPCGADARPGAQVGTKCRVSRHNAPRTGQPP